MVKLEDFLGRNRIDSETWEKAEIDWGVLQEIASDHAEHAERLRDAAELMARVLQRFGAVHSVRWRVKDAEHLLAKIIRKRAEGNSKYSEISVQNYFEVVTDLVGLRALHLFKDDCFSINRDLLSVWVPHEDPIAYVRQGDPDGLTTRLEEEKLKVRMHPAGYRSVHYVVSTRPLNRTVLAEVQVRTIFEEGWSEIDHRVRYPNFSKDPLVNYFLTIFNRLSGSADEMGTFVQDLTKELGDQQSRIAQASKDREGALSAMENALKDLEAHKKEDAQVKKQLSTLQGEIEKLRKQPSLDEILNANIHNPALSADAANFLRGGGLPRMGVGDALKIGRFPMMSDHPRSASLNLNPSSGIYFCDDKK